MSHIVFMGGLWYALTIIQLGMAYCIIKSVIDTYQGKGHHHDEHEEDESAEPASENVVSET
ncbi:hypothetical protein QUF80_14560 [Desulfococcaceae bacterium HSG8]|nr:hypothetical protein [Desulfococcaceae bacterium HSG8]